MTVLSGYVPKRLCMASIILCGLWALSELFHMIAGGARPGAPRDGEGVKTGCYDETRLCLLHPAAPPGITST